MSEVVAQDLVPVYVPKQLVTEVYRFITERTGEPTGGRTPRGDNPWLDPVFTRRAWDESSDLLGDIFRRLVATPDRWVTIDELIEAVSSPDSPRTVLGVGGALGAFTRRCKGRYKTNTWPFEWRVNGSTEGAEYRMSGDVAKIFATFEDF